MAINLFGFSISKRGSTGASEGENPKKSLSFVPPDFDDGAVPIEVGGYFGTSVDFDGTIKSDIDLIKKYRDMALHPETESAISDICNEAIVYDENLQTVKIDTGSVKHPKTIKDKIEGEFDDLPQVVCGQSPVLPYHY
jgi:hypothetical protein